jgi:hypothetical protein
MGRKPKSTPKEGHNIEGLSDAQRQALHLSQHVPAYEKALAAYKAAGSELKRVGKEIKAEGGSVAKCKRTIALRTPEGEAAFKAEMAELAEIAAWSGVGVQLDLLVNDREPADDRAFGEGKRAGMSGETARPPYDPSTSQHKRWLDGHADGQAVLSKGFTKTEQVKEAA